jgi:cytochrome c-type biogenesis protein CcmH
MRYRMTCRRRRVPPIAVALLLVLAWSPSRAAAESTAQDTSIVTHELMSPYCPELLLADCRTEGAAMLRAEITARLETGETKAAIEDDLVARYGEQIRTMPPFRGLGILAWLGPGAIGIVALAGLTLALRAITDARPLVEPEPVEAGDPALLARLREELEDLD